MRYWGVCTVDQKFGVNVSKLKRPLGRPVKPVLSRELIAEHALDFVTERGLDELTMSHLAKRLGVAPSALYNHLDNKADLVLLIQDALVSQVSLDEMDRLVEGKLSLGEALEGWARSYRRVFASYPSLIPLIAVTPVSEAPQTSHMYDTVAKALITAGIPEQRVISVIVAFESFLFGSALDLNAPADVLDAGEATEQRVWLARAVGASKANDQRAGVSQGDIDDTEAPVNIHAETPFQYGLRALIHQTVALVQSRT